MKTFRIAVIVLILLVAAVIGYYLWMQKNTAPPVEPIPEPPVALPVPPQPQISYPLPEADADANAPSARELPGLNDSDRFVKELMSGLYENAALYEVLVPRQFIRRLVMIVDALPRRNVPLQHLPLRSPPGPFLIATEGQVLTIHPNNADRYTPYVQLAEAVPVARLVEAYVTLYPLLQEAYEELGHPQGYFNDRMVEVLDHLLDTPDIEEPIFLVEHVTRYRYADPALEKLSGGRRILLRMGRDNTRRVKVVLRQLRERLADPAASGKNSPQAQ